MSADAQAGGRSHLPAADAAKVLREILAGARAARPVDTRRSFVSVAVGEWAVRAGDADLVFFVDSASLDHLARMRLADGREAGFVDWLARDGENPLRLIDEGEQLELEHLLREL